MGKNQQQQNILQDVKDGISVILTAVCKFVLFLKK